MMRLSDREELMSATNLHSIWSTQRSDETNVTDRHE